MPSANPTISQNRRLNTQDAFGLAARRVAVVGRVVRPRPGGGRGAGARAAPGSRLPASAAPHGTRPCRTPSPSRPANAACAPPCATRRRPRRSTARPTSRAVRPGRPRSRRHSPRRARPRAAGSLRRGARSRCRGSSRSVRVERDERRGEHRDQHRHDGRGDHREHVTCRHRHPLPLLLRLPAARGAAPPVLRTSRAPRRASSAGRTARRPPPPACDPGVPNPAAHREDRRSPHRDRGTVRLDSASPGGASAPGPARRSRTAAVAAPSALATLFDFGASARWSTAWARLSAASGRPTYSTACAAALATRIDCGSARPTSSEARITRRRAMNRASSPASIMRANQ